jgi:hypothetical protein
LPPAYAIVESIATVTKASSPAFLVFIVDLLGSLGVILRLRRLVWSYVSVVQRIVKNCQDRASRIAAGAGLIHDDASYA